MASLYRPFRWPVLADWCIIFHGGFTCSQLQPSASMLDECTIRLLPSRSSLLIPTSEADTIGGDGVTNVRGNWRYGCCSLVLADPFLISEILVEVSRVACPLSITHGSSRSELQLTVCAHTVYPPMWSLTTAKAKMRYCIVREASRFLTQFRLFQVRVYLVTLNIQINQSIPASVCLS